MTVFLSHSSNPASYAVGKEWKCRQVERAHYRLLQIQIPCSKIIIIQADRSESEMLMLLLPLLLLPSVRQNFIGHLIRGGGGGGDECAVVIKKAISFI